MRRPSLHWYQVQLGLALALQILSIGAPLTYGGNWEAKQTAFLHPAWVSVEKYDLAVRTSDVVTHWFYERWELAILTLWMVALSAFLANTLFSKRPIRERYNRLGNAFGGFAAQIILAYFISRTVVWHLNDQMGEIELILQREFFFLLFPIVFIYLARRRMARRMAKDEKPAAD